jgi:hypothetical protein
MNRHGKYTNFQYWPIITILGIILFIIFYFIAALYYPGGSNFNQHQAGFNWYTNYWCELLGYNAKNGQHNTARPFGLSGMIILSISTSFFWINLPKMIPLKNWMNGVLQFSGTLSMVFALFIFTHYHDFFIFMAVISGSTAFSLTILGLYENHFKGFLYLCIICLLLILMNNVIYLSGIYIEALPIIQKLTFLIVLLWICLICIRFISRYKINNTKLP